MHYALHFTVETTRIKSYYTNNCFFKLSYSQLNHSNNDSLNLTKLPFSPSITASLIHFSWRTMGRLPQRVEG